ncbi:MAG: phosphoribosylformylglycinamidine synthase subunit PurQ [Coriobacteriales bacterium]|nr:phosphoribosylformylglycinamidine synthase subunit PurQ [Coriobacteriales bacterium]
MAFRFGVVVFPGSNCEQDVQYALSYLGYEARYVWHQERQLHGFDALVLPGGFSYGDYLRCGAVARFSPVMDAVVSFAEAGGPVMGICNGFQILTEAHLLPGALLRNIGLKFLCQPVSLRVEQSVCLWTLPEDAGRVLRIPINHNEGNYICDADTLKALRANKQIVLRYVGDNDNDTGDDSGQLYQAPNGALDNIAGICNAAGNVFGLMPHPERVVDGISGCTDGRALFNSLVRRMVGVS